VKAKILYIEDNQDNLRLVKRLLTMNDYQFVGEEDAFDGIKTAEMELPDLILMDINLPGLSGYEATARIHSIPSLRDVPVVAVTAGAMAGDRERALSIGCVGYITKPIDVDTFISTISDFIEGTVEQLTPEVKARFLEEHNLRLVQQLESNITDLETAKAHLEDEVNRRTQELADAHKKVLEMEKNNVVSEMSGAIAHELNQPLSVLIGYCELLEAGQVHHGDSDDVTAMLIKQADRMALLVKKLARVTEYKTKQYSSGKIVNINDVSLTDSQVAAVRLSREIIFDDDTSLDDVPNDVPLLFMLKKRLKIVEEELKGFESCALASLMMRAVFHRLNNFFQAIRGYTDLMLSLGDEHADKAIYLDKLSSAVEGSVKLMNLFTELLSKRSLAPSSESADFILSFSKIIDLITLLYKKMIIDYKVDDSLEEVFVDCEQAFLTRLLLSFVVFTVKKIIAAHTNEMTVTISIENEMLQVSLCDKTGISLLDFSEQEYEKNVARRLMAPIDTAVGLRFFELETKLNDIGGKLESLTEGSNYELKLILPLSSSHSSIKNGGNDPIKESVLATSSREDTGNVNKKVLIVDDEVSICYIMEKHIGAAFDGYSVDTCHSSEDALILLRHKAYDLVLLDINLPGKSGMDILPVFRDDYPHMAVIIMTGLISDSDFKKAKKNEIFACLQKPVTKVCLVKTITECFSSESKKSTDKEYESN